MNKHMMQEYWMATQWKNTNFQYNWKVYLQDAIKDGISRSLFFKKLLHWTIGENKYLESRKRHFRIFLEARLHKKTYAELASLEGTCGRSRIGSMAQKFESRIKALVLEANKKAPNDIERISFEEFLQLLDKFYLTFFG